MKNLNYSLFVIFSVLVSLLCADQTAVQTESQNDVETVSGAPIERPPLSNLKFLIWKL